MLLRPYQENMVKRSLAALKERGNTLAVAPTGAGKTIILSAVAGRLGGKQCVLQHREELVTQNLRKFCAVNPKRRPGLYTADSKSWHAETSFAMVQTLQRNIASIPKLDALIIDEAHHAVASGYLKIVEAVREKNPACRIFGVTATPAPGDGKGLREVFDNCADQISLHSLISMGFLVRPRTFICTLSGTDEKLAALRKNRSGEYDLNEAAEVLDLAVHNDAVVREWKKLAGERKTIVFCSTVNHARHMLEAFLAAGVRAGMVDGEMPSGERKQLLAAFDSQEASAIQVLINVAVLTEGATELLQSYPEAATDIWARLGKDEGANEWFSRFMDALPETTRQGLYEAAVAAPWGFLGGIGKASYDRAREKAATAFAQSQTALHEQVEDVLASVKSPEIVESALEAGGQNQVVGVDARELMRLHQDEKDLLTPLGLEAEDVATTAQAGQDVHLPLSRLHSRLNQDEFAAVMPFVRQLPDALNSAEAARIDEKIAADALKAAELHRENAALFEEMAAEKTRLREEVSAEIRRSPALVAQVESLAGGFDAYVDNWLKLVERFAWRMGASGQNPVELLRKITLDNVRASRRAQMSPEEIIDDDLRELNGAAEQAETIKQNQATTALSGGRRLSSVPKPEIRDVLPELKRGGSTSE